MCNIGYKYMTLEFESNENSSKINGYVVTLNEIALPDSIISNRINIDRYKYQNILLKNGAYIAKDDSCIFNDEDGVIAAIVTLKLILGGIN